MAQQTAVKKWVHKIFKCPSFWKSVWNTITKSEPFYRCPECNKAMHCYWDGNDTSKGIDFCDKCASKH
jgi:hypothetical protein